MVTVGKRFGQKEAPYPADDVFARRSLGQPSPVVELNGPGHRNFDTHYFSHQPRKVLSCLSRDIDFP